jgi:hypothetical protein
MSTLSVEDEAWKQGLVGVALVYAAVRLGR